MERRTVEVWGELSASVDGVEVLLHAQGPVVEVRVANLAAAQHVLRSLPSLPSHLLLQGLQALVHAGLTVHVLVGSARVAKLGAQASGLASLLGVRGAQVDLWQGLRAVLRAPSAN